MHPAKVVIREVQRHRRTKVLIFLAEGQRQSSHATHEQAGVRDFVISEVHSSLTVIANATGREVLGKTRVPVREVALAIKGRVQTVLLDGVDLNIDSAKIALRHAGRVNHTFLAI
jgi:hypothetical protein